MASTLRTSTDAERVMTVWLDLPDKPVNILTSQALAELDELVAGITSVRPRAVIFASAKPRSFLAGADLVEVQRMTRPQLDAYLTLGQSVFGRISRLSMPVAALIAGDALGGGLELALWCGYRLAADDRSITIGLPEVKLGLVPGFGGTVRLPRLIGLAPALGLMTSGQTVSPKEALRLGIVDEVVPREALFAAAKRLLLSRPKDRPNLRPDRSAGDSPQDRNRLLDEVEYDIERKTRGNYPAPQQLVDVVRASFQHGEEAALLAERKALISLLESETGRNLARVFFLRQGARKRAAEQAGAAPLPVRLAAVLGGGTMGSGIAHALIRAGIDVHLVEINAPLADAAGGRVRKILDEDVAAGRIEQVDLQRDLALLHLETDWQAIPEADLVIEAVAENQAIKQAVFTSLGRQARSDAVLASNTSSLRIGELGEAASRPARVIGIHFFNPVPKMALVEIVRSKASEAAAVATGVALAARLGKSPIVVNDAPGFIVNRILMPYLSESLRLAGEGVAIEAIDQAMRDWGMPMGPFALIDQIGIDVLAGIFNVLSPQLGARVVLPRAIVEAQARGWLGRKSDRGLYVYDPKQPRQSQPPVNRELLSLLCEETVPAPASDEIQRRLIFTMINEAARVLEERVTDSAEAIDLASLLGLGMAPFRGGLIRYADSLGTPQLVSQLRDLAMTLGPRFAPAPLLVELAKSKRSISEGRR